MHDIGFEIKVESVETDIAERTQSLGSLLLGAKGLPDELCSILRIRIRLEAALAVSGSADGQEDGFPFLLAGRNVLTSQCQYPPSTSHSFTHAMLGQFFNCVPGKTSQS